MLADPPTKAGGPKRLSHGNKFAVTSVAVRWQMSLFVVICVITTCVRRVPSSSVSPMVSFCTEKAAVLLLVG